MARNTATVTPPRYQPAEVALVLDAESVREFRAACLPYGNRLQYPGRADMLAGRRIAPHTYAVRFLVAGKRAGLSRSWALRFVSWLRLAVDQLWPPMAIDPRAAEEAEQSAENRCNSARLRLALDPTPANRTVWMDAQLNEILAEMDVAAAHGLPDALDQ